MATYYTRKNVHVDRIATAWLIKRYIDREAVFAFVENLEQVPGAIPFDMPGAKLGHQGDDCSFETVLKTNHLSEPGLDELAQIIHGADILSDLDVTLESAGIDLAFRAVRISSANDKAALDFGFQLLDGLLLAIRERKANR